MLDDRETVMTARWAPASGFTVDTCDLPDEWPTALAKVVLDIPHRQFGGEVTGVGLWVDYDADSGFAWLGSTVTTAAGIWDSAGISGSGARIDDEVCAVLVSMADLLQNEVADSAIAWPWGDDGGMLEPTLVQGAALWVDRRTRQSVPIGELVRLA